MRNLKNIKVVDECVQSRFCLSTIRISASKHLIHSYKLKLSGFPKISHITRNIIHNSNNLFQPMACIGQRPISAHGLFSANRCFSL